MAGCSEMLEELSGIDWDSTEDVRDAAGKVMDRIADRRVLNELLLDAETRADLAELCEHYDILDKLVLYRGITSDFRVRLHVFLPGYFDRPHNHRWTYLSRILVGSYRHFIYGTEDQFNGITDVTGLRPLMARKEARGDSYVLHHSMVHSVVAEPYSISLIIRGPSMKDKFFVSDRETGKLWLQYGAAKETEEQQVMKRMTGQQLERSVQLVRKKLVLA